MVVASLVAHAVSRIALFAVQSVVVKVHSLVKLECMMASVSNSDRARAIAKAMKDA